MAVIGAVVIKCLNTGETVNSGTMMEKTFFQRGKIAQEIPLLCCREVQFVEPRRRLD